MNLGTCSRCHQKAEMHEGKDGNAYCEDCLVRSKQDPLQRNATITSNSTPITTSSAPSDNRQKLLDYIISTASPDWIDTFLENYKKQLKDNLGWIPILEQTQNDRILLRLAIELGYGAEPSTPVDMETDKVIEFKKKPGRPRKIANNV